MRTRSILTIGLLSAALGLGACSETAPPQQSCGQWVDEICDERGGCTKLLRAVELKSCQEKRGS